MSNVFKPELVHVEVSKIIPYTKNIKKHPQSQVDNIAGQIHAFGMDQPIVVDKDMVVIKGHGRLMAVKKLGWKEIPCFIAAHLSEEDAMAARIADNKVAESEWETDYLKFEIGTLKRRGYSMDLTGHTTKEIDDLLEDDLESSSDDMVVKEPEEQYIVSVECQNEVEMEELYEQLKLMGHEPKLIT